MKIIGVKKLKDKFIRAFVLWKNRNLSKKSLVGLRDGDYFLKYKIPYFCQFASREKVKDFIYPEYSGNHAKDDPKWKEFGAKTPKDYAYWAMNSCGIIVLRMILESVGKHYKNNMDIVNKGLKVRAYDDKTGWIHDNLIKLASKYKLKGRKTIIDINEICTEIFKNHFVVASVSPLLGERDTPITRFGHLVLVKGFKWQNGYCAGLYINNPSGRDLDLQENAFILTRRFKEGFTNRVIIFKKIK